MNTMEERPLKKVSTALLRLTEKALEALPPGEQVLTRGSSDGFGNTCAVGHAARLAGLNHWSHLVEGDVGDHELVRFNDSWPNDSWPVETAADRFQRVFRAIKQELRFRY